MSVKYYFADCHAAYLYAGRNDYGKQAVIISCLFARVMSQTGTLAFSLGEYRDNEATGEFVQGKEAGYRDSQIQWQQ